MENAPARKSVRSARGDWRRPRGIEDSRRATVVSSDESKTYEVETSADGREIASNDNASYWQGYVGYPAIAVLIARDFIVHRRT